MPITFLRAAWFTENAECDISSARKDGVIHSYLQTLDRPVPMIATDDVGHTAAEPPYEHWRGHRVVELQAKTRVTESRRRCLRRSAGQCGPSGGRAPVCLEPHSREPGMQNPAPRMQMLDGFNEGWIDFRDENAESRRGGIGIDEAIARLVARAS
jgi:NAD(P)H dehydrogenase (quinone)